MEAVELACEVEQRFGIRLPNRVSRLAVFHEARTVGELEAVVLRLRREQLAPAELAAHTDAEVAAELRRVLAEVFGGEPDSFVPEQRLVEDLAMDQ